MRGLLWIPMLVFGAVTWVVGVPLVGVLSYFRLWTERPSMFPRWGTIKVWRGGRWTWLWGNEEDGVTGATWYRALHADWSERKRAFFWSAFRNPANNPRFIRWLNPAIEPAKIRYRAGVWGKIKWDYTWQGIHSGFRAFVRVRGDLFRFWIGWKLKPADRGGLPPWDFRSSGCGFCLQFKRVPNDY